MDLKLVFNNKHYCRKLDPYTMEGRQRYGDSSNSLTYDFLHRIIFISGPTGAYSVIPFSQMDREVLECAREMFINSGGEPPELPPLESCGPAPEIKKRRPTI